jgi:hypothetical protein
MTRARQWPIIAAILGGLAVVGTGVKLATSTNPLEARVDDLLARETNSSSHEDLRGRIDDLAAVQADPDFTKLPTAKQRSLTERLAELKGAKSFQDFEKSLGEIPDPKTARNIGQIKEISQRLSQLREPDNLPDSLKPGNAIRERQIKLEDARVLSDAAEQIRKQYSIVLEAGNRVLTNKNEPKLPERIREVFALAKDLKTPENDKNKPVPGSDRLTYVPVFQLAEIQNLLQEWKKLKEKLEPAAKSEKGS